MLRIVVRPILNNYYNTTNAPTRLHLSEMKRISGSHYFFYVFTNLTSQSLVRSCSVKKVILETSQNSQENTCAKDSFLLKLQSWGLQLY